MINRAINTLMSDGKCTVLQRHWCALIWTCTANTHVGIYLFFLFIGFDLENVGLVSLEMVTELGLVVERTCFRGFRSDETSLLIFRSSSKAWMISLVIIPSKLPALIKGTSTYQTASMRICHLLVTFYKCNDTFSLRGSFLSCS